MSNDITNVGSGLSIPPTFTNKRSEEMADLNADGTGPANPTKESKENKSSKTKHTERKPVTLDKPQEVNSQIQVHRGNVDILSLKFLESISMSLARIENKLKEIKL